MIELPLELPPRPVALVTGAVRGIGLGIAAWLLVEGWQVVLADRDVSRGRQVAEALGDQAHFMALDVADEAQVSAVVDALIERFGRLDALVNNAAQTRAHGVPLDQLALDDWQAVLAINLTGPLLLARACAPHLRAVRGAIVNLTSTRAHQSEAHCEAYATSKGGLLALTHALAVSLGPHVRVNAVSPGWIDARDPAQQQAAPWSVADHAQHPVGRVGQVEDVASLVAWLLSADSSFVTGQEFIIDGGMTRRMIYAE